MNLRCYKHYNKWGFRHSEIISVPQIIQRQLEQVEEKQRQLEERGVAVEKALRGEAGTSDFSSFHNIGFLYRLRASEKKFYRHRWQYRCSLCLNHFKLL